METTLEQTAEKGSDIVRIISKRLEDALRSPDVKKASDNLASEIKSLYQSGYIKEKDMLSLVSVLINSSAEYAKKYHVTKANAEEDQRRLLKYSR